MPGHNFKKTMIHIAESIKETEWGLEIVLKEGVIIDDNSIIPTIKFIMEECQKMNKNKVVVDASKVIRRTSIFKLIEVADTIQYERIKVAFIPPKSADADQSNAMETFSYNRGVQLRYFPDMDTALEWLLK